MSDSMSIYLVRFNISGRQGFLGHWNNDAGDQTGRPFAWADKAEAEAEAQRMTEANPGNTYEVETIDPRGLTAALAFDANIVTQRDEASREVSRLTAELSAMTSRMEAGWAQARANKSDHEADITHIGERLIQEAIDRDWCREFDTIVADVNRHLHVELPLRSKSYDITYEVTVSVTRTCEGRDSDDAYQRDEGPSTQDVIDAVRSSFDIADWNVTESDD